MRIIAITGATGGLAKEIVKQLPSDDFVIALGRNVEKLEACYAERPNTVCYKLDMSSDEAIGAMVEKLYAKHGHIDVFINNTGYGDFSEFDAYTTAEIRDMFDINTFATMTFSRLVGSYCQYCQHRWFDCFSKIISLLCNKICGDWFFKCSAFRIS